MTVPATGARPPRVLLPSLASLAFVSLGLPDGLLGTAWPSMRATFGQPLDAQGLLLVTTTTAYVASSFGTGSALTRVTLGRLLAGGALATAVALLGYAASPSWWGLVALALLLGAGGGVIDAGINTYASTSHGPRMLNWLHACWGLGAALGPVVVVLAFEVGRSWRMAYALVGAAQLALALGFALTSRSWPTTMAPPGDAVSGTPVGMAEVLRLSDANLGAFAFFLYSGVEVGIGVWTFTLFTEGRGIPSATAGFWLGAFWGGLTLGRLAASVVAGRIPAVALVRGCLVVLSLGAGLLWLDRAPAVGFAGLALSGAACGPVFPTLMSTTPGRVSSRHVAGAVGLQVAAAAVGAAFLPALLGVVARRLGLEALGPQIVGLALATLVAHEVLVLRSRVHEAR
jgi:fucose permease